LLKQKTPDIYFSCRLW